MKHSLPEQESTWKIKTPSFSGLIFELSLCELDNHSAPCMCYCDVLHEDQHAGAEGGETWSLAHDSLLLARVKQTDGSGSQQLGNVPSFSPREIKGCEEKSSLTPTEICLC